MTLWLETIGMLLVAALGVGLGLAAARRSMPARLLAMGAAFALIGLILLARQDTLWSKLPLLCALGAGRIRFVVLIFAVTLGLTAPLDQLRSWVSRFATCLIMSLMIGVLISLPFLVPALLQRDLGASQTRIDRDGVCRQTRPYTCGPAAAVTALHRLGLSADEGSLALLARTGPVIGTSPWDLSRAIGNAYAPQGLSSRFAYIESLDRLPQGSILLAVVQDRNLLDHCVAVLGFDAGTVTIADPAEGLIHMPRGQFYQSWRSYGIILERPMQAVP
jgi:predicted double-glycine peptidase